MDINKLKVLQKGIEENKKLQEQQKRAIKASMKKEISLLKNMKKKSKKPEVVYVKPRWKKQLDRITYKIQYFLWRFGLYR